jgi:preprotein translocase subunit SecG
MITFITVIHITTVVILVITVLLQSGKGAEISASFGGSSQTVFGSSGGVNFFQKFTYTLAAIFMCTSLILTVLPSKIQHSVFEGYTPPAGETTAPSNKPVLPLGGDAPGATTKTVPGAASATTNTTGKPVNTAPAKPATGAVKH